MKRIVWLLVIALLLSTFSGCGTKNATNSQGVNTEKKQVTIHFTETLTSPDRTKYIKDLLKDFESKNPNIKVELTSLPWEQAHDKLMTQIATNQTPDVVEMADNWMGEMAATGKLLDLQSYFDKFEYKTGMTESSVNLGKAYKNTLYAIPYGLFIRGMFYRQDWLKEKNLPLPTTYDELFETAEKLTDPSKNRYGYSFRGGAGNWTQLINVIMTEAGYSDYFDKDGKCILRDPKAIEAFKKYTDMYYKAAPKDALNWGYNEKVDAFTSGVTGFLLQDSEVISTCEKKMKEGTFATAPLLKGPDGKRRLIAGFIGFSIFSNSQYKEESWRLISYLLSEDINTEWNKKTNTMPVMKKALEDDFFNTGYIKAWSDTVKDPDTVLFTHPQYLPEWGQFFTKETVTGMQNYLLKKQTAEETMNKWADYLEAAYKKYNNK